MSAADHRPGDRQPGDRQPGDRQPGDRQLTDQGRERKQQLLAAAAALFAERGYAATRISDICATAGAAKGLFYWYFPTKHDVFAELVRDMRRRLRHAQAAAMDADADPLVRIRQGTEASVRFVAEHTSYFDLIDVERTHPAIAEVLREGSEVYARDVEALIVEAQQAGTIADVDARLAAIGVLGAVSAFSHALRAGRIDTPVGELAPFVGQWVERALGELARA